MSKPVERVEIITGIQRRRRYTAEEKVRLVEQTMQPGMTVSAVARLYGVAPSLLFQWRRRMSEGGQEAVRADEEVVPLSRVRELENRVRELERLLGRKTMETEILREALEVARPKKQAWHLPLTCPPEMFPNFGRVCFSRGRTNETQQIQR
jgi:transposase